MCTGTTTVVQLNPFAIKALMMEKSFGGNDNKTQMMMKLQSSVQQVDCLKAALTILESYQNTLTSILSTETITDFSLLINFQAKKAIPQTARSNTL